MFWLFFGFSKIKEWHREKKCVSVFVLKDYLEKGRKKMIKQTWKPENGGMKSLEPGVVENVWVDILVVYFTLSETKCCVYDKNKLNKESW